MTYALSGYYAPGMTYDEAQLVRSKIPEAERATILQKAIAALPVCYSQKLRDCVKEEKGKPVIKGCATINEGYIADWDKMEQLVQDMPYCDAPIPIAYIVGGALAAFTVGVGVGMLASK